MKKSELIGLKVFTQDNTSGNIINISDDRIIIDFNGDIGQYVYPDCFDDCMKLENHDNYIDFINDEIVKYAEKKEQSKYDTKLENAKNDAYNNFCKKQSQTSVKNTVVKRCSTVENFCEYYINQIINEIIFLKSNKGRKIKVYNGRFLQKLHSKFYYIFESDTELNYPDSTQIKIYDKNISQGIIEYCDDFSVIISTETDFGHSKNTEIDSIEFSVEQWFLLQSLTERLNDIQTKYSSLTKNLITNGMKEIKDGDMYSGQAKAIEMSLSQPITFIWGPPGTGKTQTLAKIALEHIKRKKRVLMLSYSNVSVDCATLRTFHLDNNQKDGKLIRYGYPRDSSLQKHPYLTSFKYAIFNNPELQNNYEELINALKKVARGSTLYLEIQKQIKLIKDKLEQYEKNAIHKSSFVATTISKAVSDKEIYEQKFDVVIFDEASMAYIPQVIYASTLATKHFICMGDFNQLPPIVQSGNSSLTCDIFQYCGITNAVYKSQCHNWLCMLNKQYRMHEEISDFASTFMYCGLLKTSEDIVDTRNHVCKLMGITRGAYGLFDTSGLMSVCQKTSNQSRVNILDAFISFALALNALKNLHTVDFSCVGIITPYSSQARLLHCMAMDQKQKSKAENYISCATVHQFQGSEKDIIIYDSVDCYRAPYPSQLLTAIKDDYANKLFNVAMTRAKSKFIAVANNNYFDAGNLSSGLVFKSLLTIAKKTNLINYKYFQNLTFNDDACISFYDKESARHVFFQELLNASSCINIDIPNPPEQNDSFFDELSNIINIKKSSIKIVIRSENKRFIPKQIRPFVIEQNLMNPLTIIDKEIIWYGMPYSNASFCVNNNILKTSFYPIIRFEGKKTVRTIFSLLEMDNTSDKNTSICEDDTVYNLYDYYLKKHTCEKCNSPLQLRKNHKGIFYLACTKNPKHVFYVNTNDIDEYLKENNKLCPHCGRASLRAQIGRYGAYIICDCRNTYRLDEI